MRRFGTAPIKNQSYVPRPGVYAILPMGDAILATFQGGIHQEFQLPGGGVDPGEHPIHALHREVLEETGWRITQPRVFARFKRFVFMPEYDIWAEKICTIYVARPVRSLGPPSEVDHSAVVISALDAMSELANSGDRHFVTSFFEGPK